ncbi:MAG: hypothetical protein QOE36_419 [Gaiellaceae bacterium]|jgi:hypothetical protein|nr:hypothetical protein [Gaiellaceae bacterium]
MRIRTLVAGAAVGLVAVAGAGGATPRPVSFAPAVDYATASNPAVITAADLNGDGKLDLATANYNSGNVSVLIGNGDGTYQPKSDYSCGSGARSVVAADLNGDGKLDLAVTVNHSVGGVSVLLGNGDGTFQPMAFFPASQSPLSLAASDLNGDGKLDLAVTDYGGYVSILLGNGDGTFQPKTEIQAGGSAWWITATDLNSDGKPDLATANVQNTVSVLLGNGDGTFQLKTGTATGAIPQSVTAADFNGDGKPDLATANATGDSVSVLLGNGDGTFKPKSDFPTGGGPRSVTAADLDGDGKPDLAIAIFDQTTSSGGVSVLLGNGDGTFQPKVDLTTSSGDTSVVAADLDGDGRPDLATSDAGASVLLNTTVGNWWASETTLTATVRTTLTIAAGPAAVTFPPLSLSQTSAPVTAPVKVTSNDGFGYQLTASRTAFSAGDIPLTITSDAPKGAGMVLDLERAALEPGVAVNVGHRTASMTPAAGETWPTKLILGPVGHVLSGVHTATLTFTATGL